MGLKGGPATPLHSRAWKAPRADISFDYGGHMFAWVIHVNPLPFSFSPRPPLEAPPSPPPLHVLFQLCLRPLASATVLPRKPRRRRR